MPNLNKVDQSAAEHATDFTPPNYNIWKQQEKTSRSSNFGNSEIWWVDNLLYLYTKPFDVILDAHAKCRYPPIPKNQVIPAKKVLISPS